MNADICTVSMAVPFFGVRRIQNVKRNRGGFELLATESRKLVYRIFRANQNMEKEEDLDAGLGRRLDQVLKWVQFKFVSLSELCT